MDFSHQTFPNFQECHAKCTLATLSSRFPNLRKLVLQPSPGSIASSHWDLPCITHLELTGTMIKTDDFLGLQKFRALESLKLRLPQSAVKSLKRGKDMNYFCASLRALKHLRELRMIDDKFSVSLKFIKKVVDSSELQWLSVEVGSRTTSDCARLKRFQEFLTLYREESGYPSSFAMFLVRDGDKLAGFVNDDTFGCG